MLDLEASQVDFPPSPPDLLSVPPWLRRCLHPRLCSHEQDVFHDDEFKGGEKKIRKIADAPSRQKSCATNPFDRKLRPTVWCSHTVRRLLPTASQAVKHPAWRHSSPQSFLQSIATAGRSAGRPLAAGENCHRRTCVCVCVEDDSMHCFVGKYMPMCVCVCVLYGVPSTYLNSFFSLFLVRPARQGGGGCLSKVGSWCNTSSGSWAW